MNANRKIPQALPLRERIAGVFDRSTRRFAVVLRATTQPAVVVGAMLLGAGACTVTGVLMLAGTGWAFLAAAAVLFGLAGIALRGMLNG